MLYKHAGRTCVERYGTYENTKTLGTLKQIAVEHDSFCREVCELTFGCKTADFYQNSNTCYIGFNLTADSTETPNAIRYLYPDSHCGGMNLRNYLFINIVMKLTFSLWVRSQKLSPFHGQIILMKGICLRCRTDNHL